MNQRVKVLIDQTSIRIKQSEQAVNRTRQTLEAQHQLARNTGERLEAFRSNHPQEAYKG